MITEILLVVSTLAATDTLARTATQEVVCAETTFSRAAESKDQAAFLALVDPDARFVTAGIARGHAEIAAAWSFAFADDNTLMRWRPAVVEVTSDGNLAISRGPYRLTGTDEAGTDFEIWGTFISTWRRNQEGAWRVIFDTSGESNMTPSEADRDVLNAEPSCD